MKLEPPVPVPVDSILSWGCGGPDADDLLGTSTKFNSCDVADSTTGGALDGPHHHHHHHHHHHNDTLAATSGTSGSAGTMLGTSSAMKTNQLLSLDNLDGLLLTGATVLTTPTTPGPGPGGGHSFAELKPLPPFEYASLSSMEGSLNSSGTSQHSSTVPTRTIIDINLNLYKTQQQQQQQHQSLHQQHQQQHQPVYVHYGTSEPVSTTVGVVKSESMADYLLNPEIDDIAAIIGNAIADSTVQASQASHATGGGSAPAATSGAGGGGAGGGGAGGGGAGSGGGGAGGTVIGHLSHLSNVLSDGIISLGPDIRDPWADIDAWIESACSTVYKHEPMLESPASSVTSGTSHSSLSSASPAFAHPSLPPISTIHQSGSSSCVSSTLQALLSQGAAAAGTVAMAHMGHDPSTNNSSNNNNSLVKNSESSSMDMPLLQRRLTAGRDQAGPSGNTNSTSFVSCSIAAAASKELQQLPHTTFQSLNHVTTSLQQQQSMGPDPLGSCHSSSFPTARRSTAVKSTNHHHDLDDVMAGGAPGGSQGHQTNHKASGAHKTHASGPSAKNQRTSSSGGSPSKTSSSKMTTVMTTSEGGKEKPVHRCNICNRGFLNKSNIKVHLRTHTGEKPFKCDACAKAFRQKAHLLKHMQIHKRITRD